MSGGDLQKLAQWALEFLPTSELEDGELVLNHDCQFISDPLKGSCSDCENFANLFMLANLPGVEMVPEGTMALLESLEWRLLASHSAMVCAVCARPVDAGHADDCRLSTILTAHRAAQNTKEPT